MHICHMYHSCYLWRKKLSRGEISNFYGYMTDVENLKFLYVVIYGLFSRTICFVVICTHVRWEMEPKVVCGDKWKIKVWLNATRPMSPGRANLFNCGPRLVAFHCFLFRMAFLFQRRCILWAADENVWYDISIQLLKKAGTFGQNRLRQTSW